MVKPWPSLNSSLGSSLGSISCRSDGRLHFEMGRRVEGVRSLRESRWVT